MFFSFPSRIRTMFGKCLIIINAAQEAAKMKLKYLFSELKSEIIRGYTPAVIKEPSDTFFEIRTITANIEIRISAVSGNKAVAAPAADATPFPPLKLKKTGKE